MADLIVIVPSRERPTAARELAEAFAETVAADTHLWFAVDDNDPQLAEYKALVREKLGGAVWVEVVSNPSTMVHALNEAARAVVDEAPFAVGFMGDDHRPRTTGWDRAYLDALHELGTGIVYGNDLLQGENLPTQAAMTADIVAALGYMAPPTLRHMYVDNFWRELGRRADCLKYLPGVVVEHLHPAAGKADWDEGYARVNAPTVYAVDEDAFHQYLQTEMPAAAAAVQQLRGDTPSTGGRVRLRPAYTDSELAGIYATPHQHSRWADHRVRVALTAQFTHLIAGPVASAADLSCGDGTILKALNVGTKYFGDYAPGYPITGPLDGTIDQIPVVDLFVCCETLEHLDDPPLTLKKIRAKSRALVLSTPVDAFRDTNPEHYWAWSREGVEELLTAAGFTSQVYTAIDFRPAGAEYCFGVWFCR